MKPRIDTDSLSRRLKLNVYLGALREQQLGLGKELSLEQAQAMLEVGKGIVSVLQKEIIEQEKAAAQ